MSFFKGKRISHFLIAF